MLLEKKVCDNEAARCTYKDRYEEVVVLDSLHTIPVLQVLFVGNRAGEHVRNSDQESKNYTNRETDNETDHWCTVLHIWMLGRCYQGKQDAFNADFSACQLPASVHHNAYPEEVSPSAIRSCNEVRNDEWRNED